MLEQSRDPQFQQWSRDWLTAATNHKYSYHFTWLGQPIIQFPQDILAMQEIIWQVKPDLIIETGIAHGGSLLFSAAMLELNAACGGPRGAGVLGIDIEIRPHNRMAIEQHPMVKRISMIEGSSVAPEVVQQVRKRAESADRVLVCLDSNHTHSHVLHELAVYAPLVSVDSYCVVFDTIIEQLSEEIFADRPWGPGNSPMTAVQEFLGQHPEFQIDHLVDAKLALSNSPNGYLKRINESPSNMEATATN
jgi:cephalosporin hydroxylase